MDSNVSSQKCLKMIFFICSLQKSSVELLSLHCQVYVPHIFHANLVFVFTPNTQEHQVWRDTTGLYIWSD